MRFRPLRTASGVNREPLILLTEGRESPAPESAGTFLRRLRDGHVPLYVVLFGRGAAAPQLEGMAEASGGGHWRVMQDNLPALRDFLAAPLAGEGIYFVVLDGKFNSVRIALASSRQGSSK